MPCSCPAVSTLIRNINASKIFPFLNNDDALVKELPQYVATTQDVIISSEEKKVE
jgi:hypothetical protein